MKLWACVFLDVIISFSCRFAKHILGPGMFWDCIASVYPGLLDDDMVIEMRRTKLFRGWMSHLELNVD